MTGVRNLQPDPCSQYLTIKATNGTKKSMLTGVQILTGQRVRAPAATAGSVAAAVRPHRKMSGDPLGSGSARTAGHQRSTARLKWKTVIGWDRGKITEMVASPGNRTGIYAARSQIGPLGMSLG